jgi:hypothetical protein
MQEILSTYQILRLKNNYFLPKVGAYFTFKEIFNWRNINFKILGAYTQLSSEPEIQNPMLLTQPLC